MKSNVKYLAIIAAAITPSFLTVAHAAQRSVDARTFDIAGVKTGMDFEQAASALAAHLKVPRNQIKPDPFPAMNPLTRTKQPMYFTYEKDGVKMIVHFLVRIPLDKARPLAAWLIEYEMPWSPQNSQAMAESALAKYGQQSNFPSTLPMQWCAAPSDNPGMGCYPAQPTLELSQVKLKLTDTSLQEAVMKFNQDAQARKPGF